MNENQLKLLALLFAICIAASAIISCEKVDTSTTETFIPTFDADSASKVATLSQVAALFASLPLEQEHFDEVYDAVKGSTSNGYDEEYTMANLFASPGSGVGDDLTKADNATAYKNPLRQLISNALSTKAASDSLSSYDISEKDLCESDIQIYWPYSDRWDGEELPIITYNPGGSATTNRGYMLKRLSDGSISKEEILVDEQVAMRYPVWVINCNDDAAYTSLEALRKNGDTWGTDEGGNIIIKSSSRKRVASASLDSTPASLASSKSTSSSVKTLVLKDITMLRNLDPWFAGASEFFVKIGSIENFKASSESELREYEPTVTDFMVVVKRKQLGQKVPFNVVLVSEWTSALSSCAFMIIEDDGGTKTSWTMTGKVMIKSKSYGFEVTIPLNTRDDIVWRGSLSYNYLCNNSNITGHFGDVDLTFEIVDCPAQ